MDPRSLPRRIPGMSSPTRNSPLSRKKPSR
jgi:hypothetical protein